jgi:hypothetical protein
VSQDLDQSWKVTLSVGAHVADRLRTLLERVHVVRGKREKWVDGMPVIMPTWSWLTPTSDWSRAMRGLESV